MPNCGGSIRSLLTKHCQHQASLRHYSLTAKKGYALRALYQLMLIYAGDKMATVPLFFDNPHKVLLQLLHLAGSKSFSYALPQDRIRLTNKAFYNMRSFHFSIGGSAFSQNFTQFIRKSLLQLYP
ncbi:hypothetical protein DGI_2461 [Megalodesulfovibrio gigas DSM 1382 = ATCC 19364]|uniref:Uncharacterized protein n=1 Tax=Megalodesulfovibrio gigas (strain ATCC 19364 / DSM 1382 / NCIMB 9332 / VKM B-1759) TaxID=1121448 RepID=T2GE73_MEGG1|nr:hypothetical protein DGI_2461 [Megalodesulfovibrio gigas DSM 1382 = ATCC 19364]